MLLQKSNNLRKSIHEFVTEKESTCRFGKYRTTPVEKKSMYEVSESSKLPRNQSLRIEDLNGFMSIVKQNLRTSQNRNMI